MDLEKSFFFKMKALGLLITKWWSFEIYPKCNEWWSKDTQFRNEGLRKVF